MQTELGHPLIILYFLALIASFVWGYVAMQVILILIPVAIMIYFDYGKNK